MFQLLRSTLLVAFSFVSWRKRIQHSLIMIHPTAKVIVKNPTSTNMATALEKIPVYRPWTAMAWAYLPPLGKGS